MRGAMGGMTAAILFNECRNEVAVDTGPGNAWPTCTYPDSDCRMPIYPVPRHRDKHPDLALEGLCKYHRDLAIYQKESEVRHAVVALSTQ